MKVEIIYSTEDAMKLSFVAENIASGITKKLQPLANEIDKEQATIIFYFGCKNFNVEVNASPQLQAYIQALLNNNEQVSHLSN